MILFKKITFLKGLLILWTLWACSSAWFRVLVLYDYITLCDALSKPVVPSSKTSINNWSWKSRQAHKEAVIEHDSFDCSGGVVRSIIPDFRIFWVMPNNKKIRWPGFKYPWRRNPSGLNVPARAFYFCQRINFIN